MQISKEMKVLVVDDDPSGADLVKIILNQFLGLKKENIFKAKNGLAATEIMKSNEIDLIISDYQMPEMNGLELFRWVRENPEEKTKRVNFLLVSGVYGSEKEKVRKAVEFPDSQGGFLARPFRSSGLIEKILLL